MKLGSPKQIPLLIACAMIALVCLLASLPRAKKFESFDLSQRLEWITYDWRMRLAASHTSQAFATNLAFVEVGEAGISAVLDGVFGYQHGLYWPRHVYGRALRELTAQGAKAVAFDVLFDYLRPDHGPVSVPGAPRMGSDDFFADQIAKSGCVILAADKGSAPAERFLTNAWAVGDASSHLEPDGVRRRVHAFVDYPIWRPEIKQFARAMDLNLHSAKFEKDRIVFEKLGSSETGQPDTFEIALNPDGTVKAEDITGEPGKGNIQPRVSQRCWHMGIQLAARELGLDLSQSTVDLAGGKIVLRGKNGLERVIPVDSEGQFCIDWSLPYYDARIQKVEIQELLARDFLRHSGKTNQPPPRFQNKLVVIGSIAKGNDLSDVGASPLDKETFLVSKYWNVANSVIVGRFIRPPSWALESALILALGTLAALVTWRQQRLVLASVLTGLVAAIYSLIAARAFMDERIWLPMVSPLTSALAVHGALVTYRGIFEQSERRRVRSVFAKVVSPDVVTELLGDKRLQIGGARRNITVFFADVRGFTEFTDVSQANAENHVRQLGLTGKEAEEFYDQRAAETLKTVSLYLSIVADTIKKHNGTLDKYIGDCVMAFWGAPAAD
ncbi:MAG TPA: adenylate/guanylate cyclase domain-containing protein, partial [Verrucomicrobiae bacterium]|nr:adenylate/guanylate cyclase domain-containing protein [Verrucomicrobiae bacterium]